MSENVLECEIKKLEREISDLDKEIKKTQIINVNWKINLGSWRKGSKQIFIIEQRPRKNNKIKRRGK